MLIFIANEKKLVVELDGSVHDVKSNKEYDEARSMMLSGLNICVLRFRNEEIINDIDAVLKEIARTADMLNGD